jgi:hypothetical protein
MKKNGNLKSAIMKCGGSFYRARSCEIGQEPRKGK